MLDDLKDELVNAIKRNFILEGELKVIDNKIGLLVHNRITVQDVIATSQGLQRKGENSGDAPAADAGGQLIGPEQRRLYSQLFYLLQTEPRYLGKVPSFVNLAQTGPFIQAVAFTLFADQYSSREELLLLSVFRHALEQEFQNSLSMGSLLRGNSAVTKLIREYTRREPGQVFLERLLSAELSSFGTAEAVSFEIDPVKVARELGSEAARTGSKASVSLLAEADLHADARVREVIVPRIRLIEQFCDRILDLVFGSVEEMPYGIRWLARQIALLTRERFVDASRQDCATMVGGFVYLRFINPAIVTPDADAYKLVRRALSPMHRRNLVLVAKVLQNLSNFVLFGEKELFMVPLNAFIERNKPRMIDYCEALTSVSDLDDQLKFDMPFSSVGAAHSPTIRISMNEVFLMHELVATNVQFIAPELDDPLRVLVRALGAAPAQVKVADNLEITLVLRDPARDADGQDAPVVDTDAVLKVRLYSEAKLMLTRLLRLLDVHAIPFSLRHSVERIIEAAAEQAAAPGTEPKLAADLRVLLTQLSERLDELERFGLYSPAARVCNLLTDLAAETENRAQFRERLAADRIRIQRTLERVCSHHEYLEAQLDSYNQYLQNVRMQQTVGPKDAKRLKNRTKKGVEMDGGVRKIAPYKVAHDRLCKDGIIAESRVPEARRKKTMIAFSSDEAGTVDVEAFYHGFAVDRYTFELDDLLARQEADERILVLEYVTLDLNLTIQLLNRLFAASDSD